MKAFIHKCFIDFIRINEINESYYCVIHTAYQQRVLQTKVVFYTKIVKLTHPNTPLLC